MAVHLQYHKEHRFRDLLLQDLELMSLQFNRL